MRTPQERSRTLTRAACTAAAMALFCVPATAADDIPRTPDGRPDLSGNYDVATLTPLQRPRMFGDKLFLTRAEADRISGAEAERMSQAQQKTDPKRDAPPVGGDGSLGPAGNVGGYNAFWIDRGDDTFAIGGAFRTSIIVDPPNGRLPAMTEAALERRTARRAMYRENTGEAWWLKEGLAVGPYDDPELRPLGERCLLGFGSTSGPPMLPVLYNNLKRIVQTPDHVMILNEMVHDARIIRIGGEHPPADVRKWMGDSIGRWEGDTLVVDTTNFRAQTGLSGATEDLHVVERFTRLDADTLLYGFTVEDPAAWKEPWSGEYPWPATDSSVYEYACHEANYALGNIMRGARLLEADAMDAGAE